MPTCPKCGSKVDKKMAFCPKCGAPLTAQPPPEKEQASTTEPGEETEQREQRTQYEKDEKSEKTEKREYTFMGPLVGGIVLIILGIFLYYSIVGGFGAQLLGATFLVIVGVIVIAAAVYLIVAAGRRHPRP